MAKKSAFLPRLKIIPIWGEDIDCTFIPMGLMNNLMQLLVDMEDAKTDPEVQKAMSRTFIDRLAEAISAITLKSNEKCDTAWVRDEVPLEEAGAFVKLVTTTDRSLVDKYLKSLRGSKRLLDSDLVAEVEAVAEEDAKNVS